MRISDLVKALQHVQATHGDLPVLEERVVFYGGETEMFPAGINVEEHVRDVARYQLSDGHHWTRREWMPSESKDRSMFKAFVLGLGDAKGKMEV